MSFPNPPSASSAPPSSVLACPIPISDYPHVTLAHGGGERLTRDLIKRLFRAAFGNAYLDADHDGALLPRPDGRLAFTTDSHVVSPLIFPGGDIGTLAVNGTVNDLAMCGARPRYLSAGFILEEGLPMETLWCVAQSMGRAAEAAGVQVVAGDTKVVEKGRADGMYINTAGVGVMENDATIAPDRIRPGDAIVLSGDVGRHGMAVMARREGLEFETALESDCAPLVEPVAALLDAGIDVHCLRDLTRGGLAAAAIELASAAGLDFEMEEEIIPFEDAVRSACEILGLDPLHVACEGRFVAIVAPKDADRALNVLQRFQICGNARRIGSVGEETEGRVFLKTLLGTRRIMTLLSGEQLPRIC